MKTFTLIEILVEVYGKKKGIHKFGMQVGLIVLKAYKDQYPNTEMLPRKKEYFNGKDGASYPAVQYPESFRLEATKIVHECYSRLKTVKDLQDKSDKIHKSVLGEVPKKPRKRKRIQKPKYEPVKK